MYPKTISEVVLGDSIKSIEKDIVRGELLKSGSRIDGRDTKTVRPIKCEVGVLERTMVQPYLQEGKHRLWL